MTTRLTLRAEAGSWPIWDDAVGDAIDPASLGLPAELAMELDAWAARLDAADGWFDEVEERRAFDDEGHRLWEQLSPLLADTAELGWRGTFRDEREPAASAD